MFLKRSLLGLATAGALMVAAGAAQATTVNWFNTGVDASRAPLSLGDLDPHYTVTHDGVTQQAIVIDDHRRWLDPESPELNARWIGLTNFNVSDPVGDYVFTTTFDLGGFDANSAVLHFDYAVDNSVQIHLNGNLIADSIGIVGENLGYLDIVETVVVNGSTGFFEQQLNVLTFTVHNLFNNPENRFNPTGLLVAGVGGQVSAIPVPAALPLFVTALGAVGFLRLRRKRQTD